MRRTDDARASTRARFTRRGASLGVLFASACALRVTPFLPDAAPVDDDAIAPPRDAPPRDTVARDAVPSDGGCPGAQVRCAGRCVDTTINPFHCGACGARCEGGMVCVGGACRTPCRAPQMNCGDACIDVTADPANCGACGRRCAAGEACRAGRCRGPNTTTYRVEPVTPASWVEACGAPGSATVLTRIDDNATSVALPFAMRFWDNTVAAGSMVNVTSNGWIGLDGVRNASLGGTLPTGGMPFSVVAAHWTDVYTRETGVCVATTGAAPARRFVVEWRDAHYCCGEMPAVHLTFELVLHEGTGLIDLAYQDMRGARAATTGVGNPFGDDAVVACPGGTCLPAAGTQFRFTPMP